jgi:hypothetical protein
VWVKVVSVEGEGQEQKRVELAMNVVDQATGEDLDPLNECDRQRERGRGRRLGGGSAPSTRNPSAVCSRVRASNRLLAAVCLPAFDSECRRCGVS